MAANETVDRYVRGLKGKQREIASAVRVLILEAAPGAKESIKWSQPVYEDNGPFAYFKASRDYVTFGFWRGVDLDDPRGLLEGTGSKMRHVKLRTLEDVKKTQLEAMVKQAVRLNRTKGDPSKAR